MPYTVIDHLHVCRPLLESDFIALGLEKIWEGNIVADQSLLRRVYSRVTSPRCVATFHSK
jgi:hypothetical protein